MLSGAALGIVAGALVFVALVGKHAESKIAAALALGWGSVLLAVFKFMIPGWGALLHPYVLAYVAISGGIGLIWTYKRPFDEKDTTVLKWILRCVGLLLIYKSTPHVPSIIAIIALLISLLWRPWTRSLPNLRPWFVRPARVALTREQYLKTCDEATRQGINELREYCKSTGVWINRVRPDTLSMMQNFLDGASHWQTFDLASIQTELQRLPAHSDSDGDEDLTII